MAEMFGNRHWLAYEGKNVHVKNAIIYHISDQTNSEIH